MTTQQAFNTLMQNIITDTRACLECPSLKQLESSTASPSITTLKKNLEVLNQTASAHLQNKQPTSRDWVKQLTETLHNLNITPNINQVGKIQAIPEAISEEILKMATEIATNALKHGNATQMHILLVFQPAALRITFADNGKGMKKPTDPFSVGLSNLNSRAAKISATVNQSTASNGSLSTQIICPLEISAFAAQQPESTTESASLGRELHDMICPQIMSVSFALRALSKSLTHQHASESYILNQAFETFSALFTKSREISHQLIKQLN